MNSGNAIDSLAASIYSATLRDLSDFEYDWRKPGSDPATTIKKKRRPHVYECEIVMFNQMWGSTALGFQGIGGAAMTSAYTVAVFNPTRSECAVYFGGRFAYLVARPNAAFYSDIASHALKSKTTIGDGIPAYYKA